MFSSWDSRRILFGAQGEAVAALLRSPTRARPREGEKRCLWSPGLMGGLARGRVRSETEKRDPEKEIAERQLCEPGLIVLMIYNTATGENAHQEIFLFVDL